MMQCSCGGETRSTQQVYNKYAHVLEFQICDCGRQGGYIYYWDGQAYSRGKTACQDFAIAKADKL